MCENGTMQTNSPLHPVIQRLLREQRERHWSDRQFAELLQLADHTMWTRARTGQRPLTLTLLNAAIRFDENLADLYVSVVKSGTTRGN